VNIDKWRTRQDTAVTIETNKNITGNPGNKTKQSRETGTKEKLLFFFSSCFQESITVK